MDKTTIWLIRIVCFIFIGSALGYAIYKPINDRAELKKRLCIRKSTSRGRIDKSWYDACMRMYKESPYMIESDKKEYFLD
tara:strand:- start:56 stop:295 length:240 start_codon:yes stop_codon:yes gene_type:complete